MTTDSARLKSLINNTASQGNPLGALRKFLKSQEQARKARDESKLRFIGYVLDLDYEQAKIITSDPFKIAVGGVPRGSFLIMTPRNHESLPSHFTLLRVTGVSPTPLTSQVQQTYFELHKKSMPELDVFTQSELQWGALDCDVIGMFYVDPKDNSKTAFSGDVNNVVSAHRYEIYSPNEELLELIVNANVNPSGRVNIGKLRTTECELTLEGTPEDVSVQASMFDFKGRRTAMFGKTRLGKSNVVKLLAQGMIGATSEDKSVGQLIFDINGEYANDNPQNLSLRSANVDQCAVYALTKRPKTPSKPLKINFYETPETAIQIFSSLFEQDGQTSNYIRSFASVELPSIEEVKHLPKDEQGRVLRRLQMYWAILHAAGFEADEKRLKEAAPYGKHISKFNPNYSASIRAEAYGSEAKVPTAPETLAALVSEFRVINTYNQKSEGNPVKFDADDEALMNFLFPKTGSGPKLLQPYRKYHSPEAGQFTVEILDLLDNGKTVILDLGSAEDKIRRYFSDMLSRAVFGHQESKFVSNELGQHFIQLYFEEAHNLFPRDDKDLTGVYARFAKEGAKFHVGMVYSTQSPSTINRELLAQTENFFVGHLSSQDETKALSRVQIAYEGNERDILRARTPGYMRMLTMSNRFVIPMQADRYEALTENKASTGSSGDV